LKITPLRQQRPPLKRDYFFRVFNGGHFVKRFAAWFGLFLLLVSAASLAVAQFADPPGTGPGLPECVEAIENARVTTRILYITAHPDDESSSVLTYLARGLHSDVALLSLTRGEGGQNDLGPEQAPQLGLIRSQELLAATRGYGAKLFFTRARDFGFSKTPEETEKVWGDEVLRDMVEIMRIFRPTVVLNGWGGVHTGHGHHQAAGLLTPRAVQLAADPSYKVSATIEPGKQEELPPWGDRRPILLLDVDRSEKPQGYPVPLDDVSPLYGKSWREIGMDAFANHHTQGITGFLNSPFLRRPVTLKREDGGNFDPASLNEPLGPLDEDFEAGNRGVDPLMRSVDASLIAAREAALHLDFKSSVDSLVAAAKKLDQVPLPAVSSQVPPPVASLVQSIRRKRGKINTALALVAGLRLDAVADRSELVAGESFSVRVIPHHRQGVDAAPGKLTLNLPRDWSITKEEPEAGGTRFTISIPAGFHYLNAAELLLNSLPRTSSTPEMPATFLPEPPPLITAAQDISLDGYSFSDTAGVTSIRATSTRADRIPPRLVPTYTIAVEPKQAVEVLADSGKTAANKPPKPFDVLLRVHAYATQPGKISVGLDAPRYWTVAPPVTLTFAGVGDQYARFRVTPPAKLSAGSYKLSARAYNSAGRAPSSKDQKFTHSLEPLPTMPTLLWSEPAQSLVHAFSINVPANLRVGYITAESEPIPDALRMLGISVDLLDAQALAFRELSQFDAIVVGVRAYELRPDLPGANQRLLDYVSNGGTLVVQYERDFIWDRASYGPYPAQISPQPAVGSAPAPRPLPRITDENSPVKFLKADDPLLNRPNKISPSDFKGWVQERGLYFWTQFDPKYIPVLGMKDPGEPELNGGLVYAPVGKGTYIYTGLAFFRQIPEGVPGAYRLFVNLLAAKNRTAIPPKHPTRKARRS
jgi:LmbE family N-acetylglucosaminyl deacetylase